MNTFRIAFVAFVAGFACVAGADEPAIETHCPAVAQSNDDRDRSLPSGPGSVVLIAVGTIRQAASGGAKDTELVVERTLFGPRLSVIPLSDLKLPGPPVPKIYCLSYERGTAKSRLTVNRYYHGERIFPLDQEPVLSAMALAYTDTLILGSSSIFIGRPIDSPPAKAEANAKQRSPFFEKRFVVNVERLLYGTGPAAGETVTVNGENDLLSPGSAYIYFGHRSKIDEELENRPHYSIASRWQASDLSRVEESLARRSNYPIHEEIDDYGYKERWQEITFQGTRAEAMALLGSTFDAARTLGARRLITDGAAAIADVAAAVEGNLFRAKLGDAKSFEQQASLIRVLGILENHRADGEVSRLIGRILDKVQAGENFPFDPGRQNDEPSWLRDYGELGNFRNHSLAWLLLTLEERDAARRFGERVLKLRDLSAYGWKDEIQYVVDHSHIEDQLALAALTPRMAKLTASRWPAGFNSGGLSDYVVAFSPDDRYCAAVGSEAGKVWETADWSLASEFARSGSVVGVSFAPDSRFLYAVGGGSREVFEKWDWRSANVVQRYPGHDGAVDAMELSPDGKRIVSSAIGYRHQSTIVWDAESAKILDRNDDDGWNGLLWHPRGRWFLGLIHESNCVRVDLDGGQKTPAEIQLMHAAFSRDGMALYCLERSLKEPGASDEGAPAKFRSPLKRDLSQANPILRRRNSTGFGIEAERELDFPAVTLAVSPDSKQLVAVGADEIEVISLPDLQSQTRSKLAMSAEDRDFRLNHNVPPTAISHDLRWLILSRHYGAPELYEVRTGRRLPLGAAHSGFISRASFVENDTQLRTEGEDGVICDWDVATTKLVERTGQPVTPKNVERQRQIVVASEDRSTQYTFKSASRRGRYGPPTSYSIEVSPSQPEITNDEDDTDIEDTDPPDAVSPPPKTDRRKLGKVELRWGQHEPIGLVPDGRHFYIGAHVFRRGDLSLVSAVNVGGRIEQVHFSPDGLRYALVTGDRVQRPTVLAGVTQSVLVYHRLRVHETRTGRTLLAVDVPAPGVACVALSHEGRKAAVVGRDSTIQIWPVPD